MIIMDNVRQWLSGQQHFLSLSLQELLHLIFLKQLPQQRILHLQSDPLGPQLLLDPPKNI